MEALPLYTGDPLALVEQVPPLHLDHDCKRCALSGQAKTVCMGADTVTTDGVGGLLVVDGHPGRDEDQAGRPCVGRDGTLLRRTVQKHWGDRPVAYDNAVRCYPHGSDVDEEGVGACRPYLAQTIEDTDPVRVVALGSVAVQGLFGRSPQPLSVRRGYSWLWRRGKPVPVFFVLPPFLAVGNSVVRRWFEEDLKWALTCPIPGSPGLAADAERRLTLPPWDEAAFNPTTIGETREALASLRTGVASLDAEWSGEEFDDGFSILSLALSQGEGQTWVWDRTALEDPEIRKAVLDYLGDESAKKVGQSVKADQRAIYAATGTWVRGVVGDVRLWRKLLESDALADLETMAELVGMGGHKGEAQSEIDAGLANVRRMRAAQKKGKEWVGPPLPPDIDAFLRLGGDVKSVKFALLSRPTLLRYNARDALVQKKLIDELGRRLDAEPDIRRIWDTLVRPANDACAKVEAWGIGVSVDALKNFENYLDAHLGETTQRFKQYGDNFNPNSNPQVAALLFNRLGLKPGKRTPGGGAYATDEETLTSLKGKHPVIDDLILWRTVAKLKGTYAVGLRDYIRSDGRIHCFIDLAGARSGRTSSSDPNLQNIPSDKKDVVFGKIARDCFVARAGWKLLSADYSQLELRIAAMLSEDDVMADFFRRGEDIHLGSARLISNVAWGINPDQVTKEHRARVKPINFGILYGKSAKTLAADLGVKVDEAQKIMDAIFGKFNKLSRWIKDSLRAAQRTGHAWTWWDGHPARRRDLWRISDLNSEARSVHEHSAWNTPIQGTASDYCVASLVECVRWIEEDAVPAMLVLPVHDQLLFEVRDDCVDECAHQVRRIMQSFPSKGVPLEVDVEVGQSWGSLVKYSFPENRGC